MMAMKNIVRHHTAEQKREGGGFVVRRPITGSNYTDEDPILLLDHLGPVDYAPGEAVGAPDHPHRGFEAVMYLIDGAVQHKDAAGNSGALSPGWCQWMTAGRGLVHSEMPPDELLKKGGKMEGFQLWVNLPKKFKWVPPRYQDTPPEKIPVVSSPDGMTSVKIIAGECLGTSAHIETRIPMMYLDVRITKGGKFNVAIPSGFNSFVYAWRGSGFVGNDKTPLNDGQVVTLTQEGDNFHLEASPDSDLYMLVIGGEPIQEPVARKGGFVMNTQEEIEQAYEDHMNGKMGQIEGSEDRFAKTKDALQKTKETGNFDEKLTR